MIKHIPLVSILAIAASLMAPAASALTGAQIKQCRALGASLKVRQVEAKTMSADRDGLHETVELAGDEWEAAEALRNFGAAQATEADARKASYDQLRSDLMRKEMALQSAVGMLNGDVYDYNDVCVKK